MSIETKLEILTESKIQIIERLQKLQAKNDLLTQEEALRLCRQIKELEDLVEKRKSSIAKIANRFGIKNSLIAQALGVSERTVYKLIK